MNTVLFKDAILKAANQIGEDGKGKDGLTGYLRHLAKSHPKSFFALLGRLPVGIIARSDAPKKVTYKTLDECSEGLLEQGLTPEALHEMGDHFSEYLRRRGKANG
jgi:hypothetical protein